MVACQEIVESKCPANHKLSKYCHEPSSKFCPKCEAELRAEEKRKRRDHKLRVEREKRQSEFERQLAELDAQIEAKKERLQEDHLTKQRNAALDRKRKDLANVTQQVSSSQACTEGPKKNGPSSLSTADPGPGASNSARNNAQQDWEDQKKFRGAESDPIDSLMTMIGLEEVKEKFLDIKAKVETVLRQKASLQDERFGAVLLGNPGTGEF